MLVFLNKDKISELRNLENWFLLNILIHVKLMKN